MSRINLVVSQLLRSRTCYTGLQFLCLRPAQSRYTDIMATQSRVLVVDDDAEIRSLLRDYLQKNEYRVTAVADGKGMWSTLEAAPVDIIVLDLMLPGDDGLTLCRDLRARSNIPVIMLTARAEEADRIIGLEMGADDFLAKPFNPRELLARIKSVMRRSRSLPENLVVDDARAIGFAGWTLDIAARNLASPTGVVVALSSSEYKLLGIFLTHPNRVLERDELIDLMLSRDAIPFDRSIDVQVGRLRHRLGDDAQEPAIIKTVRGEGYVLSARVEALR
jgi:two-component system, OmpR family, response regulator